MKNKSLNLGDQLLNLIGRVAGKLLRVQIIYNAALYTSQKFPRGTAIANKLLLRYQRLASKQAPKSVENPSSQRKRILKKFRGAI